MKNLQGKFAATSEEYKFIAANNGMSKSQFMNKLGVRRANETQVMGTTMKSF